MLMLDGLYRNIINLHREGFMSYLFAMLIASWVTSMHTHTVKLEKCDAMKNKTKREVKMCKTNYTYEK